MAASKPAAPAKVAPTALTRKPAAKVAAFRLTPGAKVAPVTDGTSVTRGFRANSGQDADEHLVYVNGDSMRGLALPVIGAAIVHGVITDAEIDACRALRDS